jgi:serine protease Do
MVGIVQSKLDQMKEGQGKDVFPQNVNFAIKASVATSFLEAHSVAYRAASSGERLDLPSIAGIARRFTVLVVCQ